MKTNTPKTTKGSTVWIFILRALATLITILLCLPVVLLPISTSVPVWAWVSLAITDLVLFILLFRISPTWCGMAISLAGLVMAGLVTITASQFFAATPPITDANGESIPGFIATLEKVTLNGSEQ